jgi:hypothetical protein
MMTYFDTIVEERKPTLEEPLPNLTLPLIGLKATIHNIGQAPLAWMKEMPFDKRFSTPRIPTLFDEDLAIFRAAYAAWEACETRWLDFQPTLGTERAFFQAAREACDEELLTWDELCALGRMLESFLDYD